MDQKQILYNQLLHEHRLITNRITDIRLLTNLTKVQSDEIIHLQRRQISIMDEIKNIFQQNVTPRKKVEKKEKTYKNLPKDFNWEVYLDLNKDLVKSGIKTKETAINHFLNHGLKENRIYVKNITKTNEFHHLYNTLNSQKNTIIKDDLKFDKTKNIYLFYHIFCKNNWEEIVREQIQLIQTSNLYDNLDKIYINVIGDNSDIKVVKSLIGKNKVFLSKISNEFEFPTLDKILDLSDKEDFFGLYIHTKSSSYDIDYESKNYLNFWKDLMNHQLIKNWSFCCKQLEEYDLVGTLFKKGNIGVEEYWKKKSNIPKHSSKLYTDHFSGNFFWFNSNYFKNFDKLSKDQKLNRFNAEWYPFKNNPKYYVICTDIDYWKEKLEKL